MDWDQTQAFAATDRLNHYTA